MLIFGGYYCFRIGEERLEGREEKRDFVVFRESGCLVRVFGGFVVLFVVVVVSDSGFGLLMEF